MSSVPATKNARVLMARAWIALGLLAFSPALATEPPCLVRHHQALARGNEQKELHERLLAALHAALPAELAKAPESKEAELPWDEVSIAAVETLFKRNHEILTPSIYDTRLVPAEIQALRLESVVKLHDHPRYPVFQARLKTGRRPFQVDFSTNGRAFFLARSYELSQKRSKGDPLYFAYRDSDGAIHVMDQTPVILSTLPEKVRLSRVMSRQELELWQKGAESQLTSQAFRSRITPRTTFALNYYEFTGRDPVIVEIPRSVLEELLSKERLVINTYEFSDKPRYGMTPEARTAFGLEVEVVVLTDEGRVAIQPYMAKPVHVPELLFDHLRQRIQMKIPTSVPDDQVKRWSYEKIRELYLREQEVFKRQREGRR